MPAGYGILAPRDCTRAYHGRRAGLVPQRWLVQAMRMSLRVRMAKATNASITRVWRSVQIRRAVFLPSFGGREYSQWCRGGSDSQIHATVGQVGAGPSAS